MFQKGNKEFLILGLYLGDYLKKFYLREISRLSGLPLKTTSNVLETLENLRVLKSETSGKNKYFYLNLENIETKSLLMQAEIQKTMDFMKKYPIFQSFVKELKSISSPIIIFGSFARFSADRNSDADMLVVSDKKTELPSHLLPHKIHEINITEDNFIKAFKEGETIIEKIKENHIILNNHSFFLNLMWNKYAR